MLSDVAASHVSVVSSMAPTVENRSDTNVADIVIAPASGKEDDLTRRGYTLIRNFVAHEPFTEVRVNSEDYGRSQMHMSKQEQTLKTR